MKEVLSNQVRVVGNTGGSTVYEYPLSQARRFHWSKSIYPDPVGTWAVTFNLT